MSYLYITELIKPWEMVPKMMSKLPYQIEDQLVHVPGERAEAVRPGDVAIRKATRAEEGVELVVLYVVGDRGAVGALQPDDAAHRPLGLPRPCHRVGNEPVCHTDPDCGQQRPEEHRVRVLEEDQPLRSLLLPLRRSASLVQQEVP